MDNLASAIVESASEGIIVSGADGKIQYCNPSACKLFGYQTGELMGQNVDILVPESRRGHHPEHRQGYMAHPEKRPMGRGRDLEGRKKDGTNFPVEIAISPFQNSEGERMAMVLVTDITERKHMQDQLEEAKKQLETKVAERTKDLKESQELYRAIARNYPNGIISVLNENLTYEFIEGRELYKLGIDSERLKGTAFLDRLPIELQPTISTMLDQALKGDAVEFEIDHNENHYLLIAAPLKREDQTTRQILLVEQNITKQKEAETEMREALDRERELNELKSRFVSMASHEFRTPLSTILSSNSLIEQYIEKGMPEKTAKHTDRIRSSVTHLTGILNDFLSLEKLEKGMVHVNKEELDLVEFVNRLVDEMKQNCKSGQIIETESPESLTIHTDPQILRGILLNLLSNAIKYSPENSTIDVLLEEEERLISISVSDKGIGIPEEEQKHLFSRFFRAANASNIPGTGLGLDLVARYAQMLGGEVKFVSEEAKGSTFTVTLPKA